MKGKKLLSLVAAAAMALTSLTGAMTATAADLTGTLTLWAKGLLGNAVSNSVEINGEGQYQIEINLPSAQPIIKQLAYFTFSPIVEGVAPCTVDVNSMDVTFSDQEQAIKFTPDESVKNTGFIPTETYNQAVNNALFPSADESSSTIATNESKDQTLQKSGGNLRFSSSVVKIVYNLTVHSAAGIVVQKENKLKISMPEEVGDKVAFGSDVQIKLDGNEAGLPVTYELSAIQNFSIPDENVTDEFTKNGNLKGYIGAGRGSYYVRVKTEANEEYIESFSNVLSISIVDASDQKELDALKTKAQTLSGDQNEALDYTSESREALKKVLDEIDSTISATSTQQEVDEAVKKLQEAIDALVVDPASEDRVNELKELFKRAKALIESDYTADSWLSSSIESSISVAETALAKEIPGYWSVTNARDGLSAAFNKIVPVDTTEEKAALASAIEVAKKCELEDYTLYSFFKMSEALETAEALSDDALKSAIENAKAALDEAYAGLKKADTTKAKAALDKAIENAEAIDAENYTADTYAKVTEAINAAKALSGDALNTEINAATEAIKDAVAGLEVKPTEAPKTEPEPVVTTPTIAPTTAGNVTQTKTTAVNAAQNKKIAEKAMKQAKITKLKAKSKTKKKVTVSWKKVKGVKGYQVQISANKNFKKGVISKKTSKNKITIAKKVKSKKTYYVRVRAYTTYKSANGPVEVYSSWNKKIIKVRVK